MPIPEILQGRLRLPVSGAPMFIVSTPRLVLAQCKAGLVGAFRALNARPAAQLDDWLAEITGELAAYSRATPQARVAPFAVNQIVHSSNDRMEHDVALCVKHRVPIIITSLRPPAEVVSAVHGYGGVVFHDVINLRHAEKAAAQGVDGIIAVCAGAGGSAGLLSPFALVKQIREVFAGTIILSGAMSTGDDVLAAQALGADLAYLGTRFIATAEANAGADYKQMLVESRAEDIVYTSLFSGIEGNYLRGCGTRRRLCGPHGLLHRSLVRLGCRQAGHAVAFAVCRTPSFRTAHAEWQTREGCGRAHRHCDASARRRAVPGDYRQSRSKGE